MNFDPEKQHLHPQRLKGFDYSSQGAYAVTICTTLRGPYLADPICYVLAETVWNALPKHFPTVNLDLIAIVPDHIHFIVWLHPTEDKKPTLGTVVQLFKGDFSRAWTRHVMLHERVKPGTIWQARFYDHIIRDEDDLEMQRRYILENPEKHYLQKEEDKKLPQLG